MSIFKAVQDVKPLAEQGQSALSKRGVVMLVEWLPGHRVALTRKPSRKAMFFMKLFFNMKFEEVKS